MGTIEKIKPISMKSEEIEQSVGIEEKQKVEGISKLTKKQPKLQKLKSKPSDARENSIEIQCTSNVESTNNFSSDGPLKETIQPKSLKAEEIEQYLGVQESVDIESTNELQKPKVKKIKSKVSDTKEKSVAIQSNAKLENTSK